MRFPLLALGFFLMSVTACTPKWQKLLKEQLVEAPESQADKDQNLILQYAIDNKLPLQSTPEGIYYLLENEGTGEARPDVSSLIVAHYHGSLLDGTVFDSSVDRGEPLEFGLGGVIQGWQIAIPLLKMGGKGKFFIPSELAYGSRGAGNDIPPNSVLIFDIELIDFYGPEEKVERQKQKDQQLIVKYLTENGLRAQSTPEGLHYIIEQAGTGGHPKGSDKVKVHYTGSLLDGTVFDSSIERGKPLAFPLGGVIKGWQLAVPLLQKGGKGKFLIPSDLAYGPRGAGGKIPPNAVLMFEVELLDFVDPLEEEARQRTKDQGLIEAYLQQNQMQAQSTASGLYYVIDEEGTGAHPTVQDKVTVHYHGTLLDGTVFDSSVERGEPISFSLGQVIPGWQEGIPYLKKGGKGKLIIPSHLAYGGRRAGKIPPFSVLVFEVELIDF
ncbi:MAG: FKBP-type peptidyl-prolyl cis-trans isomerase [Bacteroidota bacterium]